MNRGKWEKSKVDKPCDGCSNQIKKGDEYMLTKFSWKDEDLDVYRLVTINLCEDCTVDFEHVATMIKSDDESF